MKNTWKGLMFGAFTGAAIGVVLDALNSGRDKASDTSARLKMRAHDAADSLGEVTHRASDWVRDQDVPARIRHTVEDVAASAPVERVRHAVERN